MDMVKKSHILISLIAVSSIGISAADQQKNAVVQKFGIFSEIMHFIHTLCSKSTFAGTSTTNNSTAQAKPALTEDPSLKNLHVVIKLEACNTRPE
jgi:hypothetical protein